ncbi:MAG: V-type ATPase 116kDa subunit family protein [Trueperaceae bacterium]|nr:V-type ATPase 116kDa subunit family protein [Trueperaceae bacterium]
MDRLTIVGRRGNAREALQALQSLGVVQIDPLEPSEGAALARNRLEGTDRDEADRWSAALTRLRTVRETLGIEDAAPAPRNQAPTTLDQIENHLDDVATQVDQLVADAGQARDERETVDAWLPVFRLLAPTLAQLEESRFLAGVPFLVPSDQLPAVEAQLEEDLEERVLLTHRSYGQQRLAVAVALRKDVDEVRSSLGRAGVAPLSLPGRYGHLDTAKAVHLMEERSQQLPKREASLEQQRAKLAEQHGATLATVHAIVRNYHDRMERLQDLAHGRYAFALQGWVPSDEAGKVRDGLQKQFGENLVIEHRSADEHHDTGVPVKLDNPGWMRPFQGLLSLFAPPRYGGFDPTWTLATFFPLFFGIVVGDIAYGLLFLAVGLWLGARGRRGRNLDLGPLGIVIPARNLPGISTVISWCAGWTMVWGVIYGEFWGNFLEHWPEGRPVFGAHGEGIFDILLFRVEVFTPLLILTLGFGTLQVLMGWAIRAYYGYKHHDAKHTWEGIGMFAGLAGVVIFATAYLTEALGPAVLSVTGVLLAMFLVAVVASGLPLMLVELISNSGHILSYLRLFAVGLSAALVAGLGTDAGFATNAAIGVPVLGELLGAVIAITINLAAVILTLVGHTLQPLRLQYVEFFTKFGFYEQSGRPYTPFRLFGGKA